MSRKGVIIVFYDLPTKTKQDKAKYRNFFKYLNQNGYVMLQKSVYLKLMHSTANIKKEVGELDAESPENCSVTVLSLSLNNFKKINFLKGEGFDVSFFSDDIIEI